MRTITHRVVGALALGMIVLVIGGAGALYFLRPREAASAVSELFVLGTISTTDAPLFVVSPTSDRNVVKIDRIASNVRSETGFAFEQLTKARPEVVWAGDLAYELTYSASATEQTLRALLVGVRLRAGDRVGRVPGFADRDRLHFELKRADGKPGRDLPLWMDAMPAAAFELLPPNDCVGLGIAVPCIRVISAVDRITFERVGSVFEHAAAAGSTVSLDRLEYLWIAHLPFKLTKVPGEDAYDLRLAQRYLELRGDRAVLESMSARSAVAITADAELQVWDTRALYKGSHLSTSRWNPETEDEYQILIDAGLICVELIDMGGQPVPQLKWQDPTRAGCIDPVNGTTVRSVSGLTPGTLEIYRRRIRADSLVQGANADLVAGAHRTEPGELPFAFEWVVLQGAAGVERLPVRLWGIKTQVTSTRVPSAEAAVRQQHPARRSIVLRGTAGEVVLASSDQTGERQYAQDLLGLGSLLGIRRSVDGLDELVGDITQAAAPTDPILLTIDPGLQHDLWIALKGAMRGTSTNSNGRRAYGVTAIALDPDSGDVLSALSWPSALAWEDPAALARLTTPRAGGDIRTSRNFAMLRGESVGSVMKVASIYAMADAGVFDNGLGGPGIGSCGTGRFGALFTRADGRVLIENAKGFADNQPGPLPIGSEGMRTGTATATAESCNTFFAFAATLLLGDSLPDVAYLGSCPVDANLRRTDMAAATFQQWVVCRTNAAVNGALGHRADAPRNWLLLPAAEDLFTRTTAAFADNATRRRSFFEVAAHSGYRFIFAPPPGAGSRVEDGQYLPGYQRIEYRKDWFAELGNRASERVFNYPNMASPGRFFGAPLKRELFAGAGELDSRRDLSWRDFGAQAIGEAGRGSALSIALLYSAAARDDGAIPAPHLVKSATAQPSIRAVFAPSAIRTQAVREALLQPLRPGGTAQNLGDAARRDGIGNYLRGKTGTFGIEQATAGVAAPPELAECGVMTFRGGLLAPVTGGGWRSLLGSRHCENAGLVFDAIHRYPARAPQEPQPPDEDKTRDRYTSFVAILFSPNVNSRPRTIVLSVISDVPRPYARDVFQQLLPAVWRWLNQRRP